MRKMLWLSGTCSKRIADSLLYACANPIHILSAAFAIQQKTLNDLCHQPQALVGNASRAYSDRKQSPAYSFCAPRYNSCLHSLRVVTSWLHQKRERKYRWTRTTIIHILWEIVRVCHVFLPSSRLWSHEYLAGMARRPGYSKQIIFWIQHNHAI